MEGGGEAPPHPMRTAAVSQALAGVERLVPIRFVELNYFCPGTPVGECNFHRYEQSDYENAVRWANEAFRPAGLQFTIRAMERYATPAFYDLTSTVTYDWSEVYSELAPLFPTLGLGSYGTPERSPDQWISKVVTEHGSPDELIVLVSFGNTNWADRPYGGKAVFVAAGGSMGNNDKLAHELGHHFGLAHTFEGSHGKEHPDRGTPITLADQWDLVVLPSTSASTPHTYFSSRATAASAGEANLRLLHQSEPSCAWESTPQPRYRCLVQYGPRTELRYQGDPVMRGMAFVRSGASPGGNLMSYMQEQGISSISDSQVELVRAYLRHDTPITLPLYQPGLSSKMTEVGRPSYARASFALDFDGDGRRDLAVWIPPLAGGGGQVQIRLSSQGFSQLLVRSAALAGDTPVFADYDGDSRTDVAFFRAVGNGRGSDLATWWWCPSAGSSTPPTCTTWPGYQFGLRGDMPIPGVDMDGNPATTEFAVWRPSSGQFFWGRPGVAATALVNDASLGRKTLPVTGFYDNDGLSDVALWEPSTATLRVWPSGSGWAAPVTRVLPAAYASSSSPTTPAAAASALVVPNMFRAATSGPRREGFGVWDPQLGNWDVLWNPAGSASLTECQWGAPGDVPVGGLGVSSDLSQLAVVRPGGSVGDGVVYRRPWSCGTPLPSGNLSTVPNRHRVMSAADMFGDGLPEILEWDMDSGWLYVHDSASGYSTYASYSVGVNSVLL